MAEPVASSQSPSTELVAARQIGTPDVVAETQPEVQADPETLIVPLLPQVERRDFVLLEAVEPELDESDQETAATSDPFINALVVASDTSSIVAPVDEVSVESVPIEAIEPEAIDQAIGEVADEFEGLSAGGFLLSLFSSRQD